MGRKNDRSRINTKMALTGLFVFVLIAVVVYSFMLLQKQREKAISSARNTAEIEITDAIDGEAAGVIKLSSESEEGDIYLIRGNDKGANPYERVDRLAYTDRIRYTQEELSRLDSYGLRITRNEIYARHGRMFNDQDIQEYFNNQEWYIARSSSAVFDESCLNEVEQYNLSLIISYELKQNY